MSEFKIDIKRNAKPFWRDRWIWVMAWRDAKHNYSRLFLFVASLITGIAAVVALDSLNRSLQEDIDRNARELLGADLVVNANRAFEDEVLHAFDSTGLEQATEVDMNSMVLFLNNQQSRLVRLVALEGPFPFYGEIVTQPDDAYQKVKSGNYVMLDEALAIQYEVSSGDSIKLGNKVFTVAGVVQEIPGGGGILSTFTPSVYISMVDLEATGLVQFGSRVNYKRFFKTSNEQQADQTHEALRPLLKKHGHNGDTVQERKEELGEAFHSIYQFFSLLAFIALILGCIGVASSVHIYAREKRDEVAVLRCLGSTGWQAFNIYFVQIFILGVIGSIVGSLIGVGIQQLIPLLIADAIPFIVQFSVSWTSLLLGLLLGTVVSILFSVLPLVAVRFVPPLTVLRTDFISGNHRSKVRMLAIAGIVAFPFFFTVFQTGDFYTASGFTLGLFISLLLLAGFAYLLLRFTGRFFPSGASFVWRHALSNLFRPNNQTRMLIIAIGLGAFIISILNVVEKSLLSQVEFTGQENQSNTILFDIQPYQKEGVVNMLRTHSLPVHQVVPIVTCRLSEVKGKTIAAIQADTTDQTRNWAITREYRVTYRDSLHASEELVKGEIQHTSAAGDSIFVTMSEGMQDDLGVDVGDSLVFDIQGVPMKTYVSGIRKVEWPKDPPNFIFVFPRGVLEEAPQVYVTSTRIDDQTKASRFQHDLIASFPNVSLIDLRLILSTINELFDKLGLIVRFLALFSIITGLIVLAGAVINSKFVRIKENVLLRTIGARTRQISKITLIEYAYLGVFSAFSGMMLSLGGGWILAAFFFKVTFAFDWLEVLIIFVGIVALTMLIGWWNSRDVINTPPLQILRKEG